MLRRIGFGRWRRHFVVVVIVVFVGLVVVVVHDLGHDLVQVYGGITIMKERSNCIAHNVVAARLYFLAAVDHVHVGVDRVHVGVDHVAADIVVADIRPAAVPDDSAVVMMLQRRHVDCDDGESKDTHPHHRRFRKATEEHMLQGCCHHPRIYSFRLLLHFRHDLALTP